jgi:aryl-alcohol dehydrogenase-like predicted oxidoreductase
MGTLQEKGRPMAERNEETENKPSRTAGEAGWHVSRYNSSAPIPGSKNKARIIENLDSAAVTLTDAEFEQLESELNKHKVCGHRGLGGF